MTAITADAINNYFEIDQESINKIKHFGTALQIILPASTLLYSLYREDYIGFGYIGLAFIVNKVAIETLKRLIPENRPNGNPLSFPSGHAMGTACAASSLINRYGSSASPIFITAQCISVGGVGLSRVIAKAHWVHDVAAGAFFGALIGCYLVPPFE